MKYIINFIKLFNKISEDALIKILHGLVLLSLLFLTFLIFLLNKTLGIIIIVLFGAVMPLILYNDEIVDYLEKTFIYEKK